MNRKSDTRPPRHMIAVGSRTWHNLMVARRRAEAYIASNPEIWPDAEDRHIGMSEFIDMMISLLPSEYRDD